MKVVPRRFALHMCCACGGLDAARDAIPKKRVVVKETVYDEATGKAKSALRFEHEVRRGLASKFRPP